MTTARIIVDGTRLRVYGPYSAGADLRTLPGRTWDKAERCWVVPVALVDEVEAILRVHAEDVEVTDDPRAAWPKRALAAVPPEHRPELHRVLAAGLRASGATAELAALDAAYSPTGDAA